MFKIIYLRLVILFLFVGVLPILSQAKKEMEMEMEKTAYNFLNDGDYANAYTKFDELNAKYPEEFDYKMKLGICCLKNPERKERAIEIFQDIKKTEKIDLAIYYLGKAYHENYKFDEAIAELNIYIKARARSIKKEDKELVADARLVLQNCKNGKMLIDTKVIANIKNIELPINNDEEQYVPVITTDESILFFTYIGKFSVGGKLNARLLPDPIDGRYNEDVYIAYRRPDNKFSDPIGIDFVNTKGNDAAIAISPDGQTLFTFYSDSKNSGDIAISKLVGEEYVKPVLLNKNINSKYWEGSCSISADERFLFFASERPGGVGKRDIWVSEKLNGDWAPPKNLGSNINTPYDEDSPFIHPDGITLFLSSKGHSSIGGYDIMYSVKKDNEWTTPKNMGLPLNTTENDRYYVINSKGDRGYFSSDRANSGGKGKNDIYIIEPGILGERPLIALLKGTVYGNDQPSTAKIEITSNIKKEKITKTESELLSNNEIDNDSKLIIVTLGSNSTTGKYLTILNPGAIYRIKVSADNYESVEAEIDTQNLKEYIEITKDFYLVSTQTMVSNSTVVVVTPTTEVSTPNVAVVAPIKEVKTPTVAIAIPTAESTPSIAVNSSPCSDKTLPDFTPLKGKSLNDINYYKQLLNIAGDYCAENLILKVQIGAYRKPENFKYPNLQSFGKAEVANYADGITRFTQKEFTTLKAAELHRQKAIAKGQTDAWIVAFVDGKRYTLEDLIMLDFLGKTIN